jgi:dTMP kinase
MEPRGCFITLEGGEGVGKSTQLPRIAAALRARGLEVVTTREPGGTPGAEAIRALLLTGDEDRWSIQAEAFLFAAARADHVERVILPALERGAWVVCDRFIDSTRAYQGGAGGLHDEDILALHRIGCDGFLPDRTLVLALHDGEGLERTAVRDGDALDRMGARDAAYFASVDLAFLRMATSNPDRFRIIDAAGSIEDVTTRLMGALDGLETVLP